MKYVKYLGVALMPLIPLTGCTIEEEAGPTVDVTIDGTLYTFKDCGIIAQDTNTKISCLQHTSDEMDNAKFTRRITLTSSAAAGGEFIDFQLVDIPDPSLIDSPYGIEYECDTDTNYGRPCLSGTLTHDESAKSFVIDNLEVAMTYNKTGEFGTFVAGATHHIVSATFNYGDFKHY